MKLRSVKLRNIAERTFQNAVGHSSMKLRSVKLRNFRRRPVRAGSTFLNEVAKRKASQFGLLQHRVEDVGSSMKLRSVKLRNCLPIERTFQFLPFLNEVAKRKASQWCGKAGGGKGALSSMKLRSVKLRNEGAETTPVKEVIPQ